MVVWIKIHKYKRTCMLNHTINDCMDNRIKEICMDIKGMKYA